MIQNRRGALGSLAASTLAVCSTSRVYGKAPSRRLGTLGVILGSVGKALNENPAATLRQLAKLGYKELEFSGPPKGVPAVDFKKMVADVGLVAVAGGAPMVQFKNALPTIIENAHFFERKYVVCYWPWADKGLNKQIDDWKQLGATLNDIGSTLKKEGLRFAYHNHDIEFAVTNDQIPYDTVLAHTDPALVTMELDIYWIYKGNQDAAKYVAAHPGRFSLFHVKDMGPPPQRQVACVGEGTLPFGKVFASLQGQPGERHFFWELENTTDGTFEMSCAAKTAQVLTGLRF